MIVVAGGAGVLGTRLVRRLAARGLPVRVVTRDSSRAAHLAGLGVEVARGDVRQPESLNEALAGAHVVVSAIHGFAGPGGVSPASVDRAGNVHLIDAASRVGARFVLMSVVGAAAQHPMELFRAKHAAEQELRASTLPWTIVRATAFMETWGAIMGKMLRSRRKIMVFGRGDNPINFVSAGDVAALLELAVTTPELSGRTIELGGPDSVTFNQMAAAVQAACGLKGSVGHIPTAVLRLMAVAAAPVNPAFARQARAAVAMDTDNMAFDAAPTRREFPNLPNTPLPQALKELAQVDASGSG